MHPQLFRYSFNLHCKDGIVCSTAVEKKSDVKKETGEKKDLILKIEQIRFWL
jgi:hypothetical protein